MRIGKVIGRIVMTQTYDTLVGGRFLLVEVQDRFSLTGQPRQSTESLVVYDHFGATDGDLIAFLDSDCQPGADWVESDRARASVRRLQQGLSAEEVDDRVLLVRACRKGSFSRCVPLLLIDVHVAFCGSKFDDGAD